MKRGTGSKGKGLSVLLFVLIIFLRSSLLFCQTLDQAEADYLSGELDEAKQILLKLRGEQRESPRILFLLGKTEEKGDLSEQYLQEVINRRGEWVDCDGAWLLMCKYQFSKGMHVTTADLSKALWEGFPESDLRPEALWFSGCSFLAMEKTGAALAEFDRMLMSCAESPWAPWAQLSRGDCLFLDQDYGQAIGEYHKVLDGYRDSEAFPLALSGLVRCYSRLDDSEKALLYYNLLKERFPLSVESVEMFLRELEYRGEAEEESRAEEVAGVKYTVQLGVFGVEENAARLRSRLEKQGYRVRIRSKIIGGKKYSVVQIGSFTSYQEALGLKRRLESQTGESYRVVIK